MEMIYLSVMVQTIVLILILAIFFVTGQAFFLKNYLRKKEKKSPSSHIEAKAIILAVERTDVFMNQQPLMKVQMQVIPEKGRNFITEVKEVFTSPDLVTIRSGATVTVKYNSSNHKEIQLLRSV